MAKSFNSLGIDLIEVIEGASSKPFGFMPFYPGPGVGGHCIPVDPYYLIERAKANNFDHQFLKLAREINLSMPNYVVNILQKELNKLSIPIENSKIGIYGLAYKKNVDDIRESPSLKIIQLIKELGAEVKVYDPFVKSESDFNNLNEFLAHIDHLIIATDHDEILKSNPQNFEEKNIKLIIDCKSNLDQKDFNSTICKGIGK
jgi:UDP-N-acetyl-D-glucosamine dehydrogenase